MKNNKHTRKNRKNRNMNKASNDTKTVKTNNRFNDKNTKAEEEAKTMKRNFFLNAEIALRIKNTFNQGAISINELDTQNKGSLCTVAGIQYYADLVYESAFRVDYDIISDELFYGNAYLKPNDTLSLKSLLTIEYGLPYVASMVMKKLGYDQVTNEIDVSYYCDLRTETVSFIDCSVIPSDKTWENYYSEEINNINSLLENDERYLDLYFHRGLLFLNTYHNILYNTQEQLHLNSKSEVSSFTSDDFEYYDSIINRSFEVLNDLRNETIDIDNRIYTSILLFPI